MTDKKKETKLTADETKKITSIHQDYQQIQIKFGEIHIKNIQLEQQKNELESQTEILQTQYLNAQTKEQEFLKELNEKYGDGSFDLQTGIFTPTESPKE